MATRNAPDMSPAEMLRLCRERAQAVVDAAIKDGTWKGVTRTGSPDEVPILPRPGYRPD